MKRSLKICLLFCLSSLTLLFLAGCGNVVDGKASVGSLINPTAADAVGDAESTSSAEETEAAEEEAEPISAPDPAAEPEQEPTPEPTPAPGPDGGSYDYSGSSGGGDSGGGISSFSSGGSSSSSLPNPQLPDPANGAVLETPGRGLDEPKNIVDILENVKLRPDGTLDTTNKNYANDMALAHNLEQAKAQLREDKYFSNFYFLTVIQKSEGSGEPVRIKLDKSYKGKIAYVFFVNGNGDMVNMTESKDYVSYVLDENHFADNVLKVNFGSEPGTFIIAFGAK